jgi:hypothetical protein
MATKKAQAEVNVAEELLEATGAKPMKKKETPVEFAGRIAEAVAGMDEDGYEELSKPAKAWYEKAVKALNAEKDPPALPGTEGEAEEGEAEEEAPKAKRGKAKAKAEEAEEDEAEEEDEKPAKRGKAKAKAEEDEEAEAEEEDEEEAPKAKRGGKAAKKAPAKGKRKDEDEEESPKAKRKAKAEEDDSPRVSVSDLTLNIVCKAPKLSLEAVEEKVIATLGKKAKGHAQIELNYKRAQRIIGILRNLGKMS